MKRLIVRIGLGIFMGGLLSGGLLTNSAMAALVTFNFTGTVTDVGNQVDGGLISDNQPVTGSYTFESGAGGSTSGNTRTYTGALNGPATNLNVTIGTYVASLAGAANTNRIEVKNTAGMNGDSYLVAGLFSGSALQGHAAQSFELSLKDGGNAFASLALPTTTPSLNSFTDRTLRLVFDNGGGARTVIVALGPLTAVPLPPAVILFGAGLIALVGFGAGGWRKRNNSLA